MLNFNGETGPYVQYTYVRTNSVLKKAGYVPELKNINVEELTGDSAFEIIKLAYEFENIIKQTASKNEPSILSHYLIDVAKAYSSFYNENKIIVEEKSIQDARLYLTYVVHIILKIGATLLGIEMPEKM